MKMLRSGEKADTSSDSLLCPAGGRHWGMFIQSKYPQTGGGGGEGKFMEVLMVDF